MSDVRSLHTWSCHKSYYLLDTGDFLFMLSPNAAVRLRINNRLHGTVRHDIAKPQSLIILHPFLHIRTHIRTHIQALQSKFVMFVVSGIKSVNSTG